jgi:ankyrin repeat protein
MKYIKLFENFEDYDPYELMITPPNKKSKMLIDEIQKEDKANLNLVRDLISLGVNLDWQDEEEWTMLLYCVRSNQPEIARMLIDAGADLNIQNEFGSTALQLCVLDIRPEIAKMLIDAGADLNIQNTYGRTALHLCAIYNHPGIVRMLIDAGADKTIPNNNGTLPYKLARTPELKELLKP